MTLTAAALRAPLFVPGDRPERFTKAADSGATAIIIDLEDAVQPDKKSAARANLVGLRNIDAPALVRINGADTPWFEDDLDALRHIPIVGVVVPKVDSRAVLERVSASRPSASLVPLMETCAGFAALADVLSSPGVLTAAFGSIDLSVDLGCAEEWEPLLLARSELVMRSRLAGIAPPVDGVTLKLDNDELVAADARRAKALGFGGKLAIHPRQISSIFAAFHPSIAESNWADAVIEQAANSPGAFAYAGQMIDKPIIERARRIKEAAQ